MVGLERRSSASGGGEAASVERPVAGRGTQTGSQAVPHGGGEQSSQPAPAPPARGISSWTVEEVVALLERYGMGEWKDVFRREKISGVVLVAYSVQDLVEELVRAVCVGS